MYLNLIFIILSGLAGAYFECERLVSSGKWSPDYVKIPFWDELWILPMSDSYHLMFGFTVAFLLLITKKWIMFTMKNKLINFVSHTVFYWLVFWWIRNIGMHILFVNDFRWTYLLPPIIGDIVRIFI